MLVELDRALDVGILTVAPSADTRRWDLAWLERWLADPARPAALSAWQAPGDPRAAMQTYAPAVRGNAVRPEDLALYARFAKAAGTSSRRIR